MPTLLRALALLLTAVLLQGTAQRPNLMFLLSEDNSIHYLRLYGYEHGRTPHIEKLAAEGLTFNHAFSNAPVCSVARSTLATGILAPRAGLQYHRKTATGKLPPGVKPWSAILRDNGYFCTNIRKTDYNFSTDAKLWDKPASNQSPWSGRKSKSTPFFHMQSFGSSHESSLHFPANLMQKEKTATPADKVKLHPYHPDTPTFRYTHARYFDRQGVIDAQIGAVVQNLRKGGLLEDTFIFYFGDHGGVLPRSKGYAYESGLHVPLVVRIPENFKHLLDGHGRGTRTDGFVSFIDFGPTLLHLAGIPVPKVLDGKPFLGKGITAEDLAQRDETFGYADRFDEKYDLVRTLRKGRYKYNRNYQAFYPDSLHNFYRYKMLAFAQWRTLYNDGKLQGAQKQFFERRPAEQLFDIENDPHEVNDLAGDPAYAETLKDLRQRLTSKVKSINDLSFFPENHMVRHALGDGIAYGQEHADQIARLVDIADLALAPIEKARPKLLEAMKANDETSRYWACITSAVIGKADPDLVAAATGLLDDKDLMVRVRAAEFLGSVKAADPMPALYGVLNTATTEQELTLAFNTVVYLRDHKGYAYDPAKVNLKFKKGLVARRTEYLRK